MIFSFKFFSNLRPPALIFILSSLCPQYVNIYQNLFPFFFKSICSKQDKLQSSLTLALESRLSPLLVFSRYFSSFLLLFSSATNRWLTVRSIPEMSSVLLLYSNYIIDRTNTWFSQHRNPKALKKLIHRPHYAFSNQQQTGVVPLLWSNTFRPYMEPLIPIFPKARLIPVMTT